MIAQPLIEKQPRCNLPVYRGPANTRYKPIGSIKVNHARRRPYVIIKVSDTGPKEHRWRYLAMVVWERMHGAVPEGVCLWHKNGNSLDCREENLEAITKAERLRRNIRNNLEKCRAVWAGQAKEMGPKYWRVAVEAHRLNAFRRHREQAKEARLVATP
jgi:hypothetical protein